jgi:predicted MPP superfamily phosphohydrolase
LSWISFLLALSFLFVIDYYIFQGVKTLTRELGKKWTNFAYFAFWGATAYILLSFFIYKTFGPQAIHPQVQRWSTVLFFVVYASKLPALLFLLLDDLIRFVKWLTIRATHEKEDQLPGKKITRSRFLVQASIVAAAIPATSLGFGILSGAYDYRLRKKRIVLPNLPKAFDGIRIGQLSDIHSGSFYNKTAVQGGVDILLNEKVDIFMFTGDLVNNQTAEVKDYKEIFAKIAAPLGAFSTLGNHDYGDYRRWSSAAAKQKNLDDMIRVNKELGWDLLMNENRLIKVDGEEIGIIGIENWGAGRFSKYGNLAKAYQGIEDTKVKILLSHDPSHWDAQVRPEYSDIDLMLSGHTHGFQFGVEIGNFRWSPSQYMYKQWADLYTEGEQHLYVNRGFGFLGYPGRVGILPEITILELVRA